jgi:hypothetical protein
VTYNQLRAAQVVAEWSSGDTWGALGRLITTALDEAEARGRAEVAAKVRRLHCSLLEDLDSDSRCVEDGERWPCDTEKLLRALIAEDGVR